MPTSHANYLTIHVNPTRNDMAYDDMPKPMAQQLHTPLENPMEPELLLPRLLLPWHWRGQHDPGQDSNWRPRNVYVNTYLKIVAMWTEAPVVAVVMVAVVLLAVPDDGRHADTGNVDEGHDSR